MLLLKLTIFILTLFLILFGWYTYLTKGRGLTPSSALERMGEDTKKICYFIKNKLEIRWQRKEIFFINQDIRPFEKQVKELHICKYFKFFSIVDKNRDIAEIRFKLLGISSEYKENTDDLAVLLCNLFQDFYIERLGAFSYPIVYVTNVQEGEIVFHVAKNVYGNQLIAEQAVVDAFQDMPNMEDLEDD